MSTERRLSPETLSLRLEILQQKIKRAAEISGRDLSCVTLAAVTKTVSAQWISHIISLGIQHVGENKVQEALSKRAAIVSGHQPLVHHFLGHLQTNKARKAVELFDVIQSVDSLRLLDTLNRVGTEVNKKVRCLVEINIGDEASKTGISVNAAPALLKAAAKASHIELQGLMGIAPLNASPERTRLCFKELKIFFDQWVHCFGSAPVLSMGMSDDFEMAIEEGSTMVRIGRGLFGERI